jgi:hypothetical protein
MGSDLKAERRGERSAAGLVVESSRLCTVIDRMFIDGELLSQMATMIRDGALEYERVVMALRQVRKARSLDHARKLAEDCLREI